MGVVIKSGKYCRTACSVSAVFQARILRRLRETTPLSIVLSIREYNKTSFFENNSGNMLSLCNFATS
jgi:hypothetical protein